MKGMSIRTTNCSWQQVDHPIIFRLGTAILFITATFEHYKQLRSLTETGEDFVVIGGSFIGSEMAAALTIVEKKTTLIVRNQAICYHIFPSDLAFFLNDYYRQKGVEVVTEKRLPASKRKETGSRFGREADAPLKQMES